MTFHAQVSILTLNATSLFVSKEKTRPYLGGVCLEIQPRATTYVATDGHRLLARRLDLVESDPDNTLVGTFLIPYQECKAFKASKALDTATLSSASCHDVSALFTLDFEGRSNGFKLIDGVYPDWRRILPQGKAAEGALSGRFNCNYMADFAKAGKILGFAPGSAALIAAQNEGLAWVWFEDESTFGVIMPLRGRNDSARTVPAWVSAAPSAASQAA
jgi:DNA polymerase III sliding clamp (beta) subunit (PCNA family)